MYTIVGNIGFSCPLQKKNFFHLLYKMSKKKLFNIIDGVNYTHSAAVCIFPILKVELTISLNINKFIIKILIYIYIVSQLEFQLNN